MQKLRGLCRILRNTISLAVQNAEVDGSSGGIAQIDGLLVQFGGKGGIFWYALSLRVEFGKIKAGLFVIGVCRFLVVVAGLVQVGGYAQSAMVHHAQGVKRFAHILFRCLFQPVFCFLVVLQLEIVQLAHLALGVFITCGGFFRPVGGPLMVNGNAGTDGVLLGNTFLRRNESCFGSFQAQCKGTLRVFLTADAVGLVAGKDIHSLRFVLCGTICCPCLGICLLRHPG